MSGELHINWTRPSQWKQVRRRCPTCKRRTQFWGWFQEWYGWHITCLSCGDAWQDGEMLPRPFCPGWRRDRIVAAKKDRACRAQDVREKG